MPYRRGWEIGSRIWDWMVLLFSRTTILIRMLNLVKITEFAVKKPANFVASVGWCNRFIIYITSVWEYRSKLARRCLKNWNVKLNQFKNSWRNRHRSLKFGRNSLYNMIYLILCYSEFQNNLWNISFFAFSYKKTPFKKEKNMSDFKKEN